MTEPTVRVHQLAATLGVATSEAISRLEALGISTTSPSSRITFEETQQALAELEPTAELDTARRLILRAFATARSSGQADWRRMPVAVLKNRLLDLTDRGFNEKDYGAPTFGYFCTQFPETLEVIILEGKQPQVFLKEGAVPQGENAAAFRIPPAEYQRLRQDLWKAFVDFRSGRTYVWDVRRGIAEPGAPAEFQIPIPTITPAEESNWRADFVSGIGGDLEPDVRSVLEEWHSERLPTSSLPAPLRGPWNGYLRDHIVERINQFFDNNSLAPPNDLLVRPDEVDRSIGRPTDTMRLRSFVQRVIAHMNYAELEALLLPVGALARAEIGEYPGRR